MVKESPRGDASGVPPPGPGDASPPPGPMLMMVRYGMRALAIGLGLSFYWPVSSLFRWILETMFEPYGWLVVLLTIPFVGVITGFAYIFVGIIFGGYLEKALSQR